MRNGVAPLQPSRARLRWWRGSVRPRRRAAGRTAARRPARALRDHPAVLDHDDAAADSARRFTAKARSLSFMPTTTRLWASWATSTRGRRAARPALRRTSAPRSGAEVALDDRDLDEAASGSRPLSRRRRLALARSSRHDLVLDQARSPCRAAVRRDLEIGGGHRPHPHRMTHPARAPRRPHVLRRGGRASGRDRGRTARGPAGRAGPPDSPARPRPEIVEAVPLGGVERRHEDGVLGGFPARPPRAPCR